MKICGLTGGVGMGKSTAAGFFLSLGARVVDTDEIARQLVQPGQPALAEIRDRFGATVIAPDGSLRRDLLAQIVSKQLSAILGQPFTVEPHPGNNGNTAAAFVAHAAPDGYTLLLGNNSILATNVSLYNAEGCEPLRNGLLSKLKKYSRLKTIWKIGDAVIPLQKLIR